MLPDLFSRVLQLSLAGSVTAAAIMLVKVAAGRRLTARWHYAIWFLLLLKLAVPVSIASPVSIFNLLGPAATGLPGGQTVIMMPSNPTRAAALPADSPADGESITALSSVEPAANSNPARPLIGLLQIGAWVWITGTVLLLGAVGYSYRRIYCRIGGNGTGKAEPALELQQTCRRAVGEAAVVRWVDSFDLPFVIGVCRPVIIMPPRIVAGLDEKDINTILRHEVMHIKYKDHLIRSIVLLLQAVHWFNPILWIAFGQMMRDCEAACDEAVLRGGGTRERREYAAALVSMAQNRGGAVGINPMLAFGESDLKRRVTEVLKSRKYSRAAVSASVLLWLALAVIMLTGPANGRTFEASVVSGSLGMPPAPAADGTTAGDEVERLLAEIIAAGPTAASNPYDYVKDSRAFADLVALGNPARQRMLDMFAESNADGLKEYIMACACARIMGIDNEVTGIGIDSGREWYYKYGAFETDFSTVDADYDLFADMSGKPKLLLPIHTDTQNMDEVITNCILSVNRRSYRMGEKAIEAHQICRTEVNGRVTDVYLLVDFHWFGFEDGSFTVVSGSDVEPVRIRLERQDDGAYTVLEYRRAKDEKGRWIEGFRNMFPADAEDATTRQELWESQVSKAKAYLAEIGREEAPVLAAVAKERTDKNVTGVLYRINLMRPEFPDWNGTREILVRTGGPAPGTNLRCVLETRCQPDGVGQYTVILTRKWNVTINGVRPEGYWRYRVAGDQVELVEERVNDEIIRTIK